MTPQRLPPDDPREWLNRARANLVRARMRAPGVYLEDLCFDAQQTAEKAIKAVLIQRGVEFPYTHDLGRLLALVLDLGESIPDSVKEARELSTYAWLTRYPAVAEPITDEEYAKALYHAEEVLRWAEERLGTGPASAKCGH